MDVLETFTAAMRDPSFAADISGAITVGTTSLDVTGEAELAGADMFQELTVQRPGGDYTSATLQVDGEAYTRTGAGPWVRVEGMATSSLGEEVDAVLGELEDEGLEEIDGESLHHLVPPSDAEFDSAAFGITDPAITDFSGTVDFYATSTGEPALMRFDLAWTQSGEDAEMVLQYDIDPDADPTVEAPEEAWISFNSDRFAYGIAYPEDWENQEFPAEGEIRPYDAFYSLQGSAGRTGETQVYGYAAEEVTQYTASEWFTDASIILTDDFGVDVEFTEEITVAGIPSRYFSLHYVPEGGTETFFQEAVVYTDAAAWDIDWYSDSGNEETDRETFDLFLETFVIGGAAPASGGGDGAALGNVWELSAGECFTAGVSLLGVPGVVATYAGGVEGYEPADCASPHAGEVIAVLEEGASTTCSDAFAGYVGMAAADSSLGLWTFIPVDASYERIPGPSLCVVGHPSGSLTGSVQGSAQ